MPRAVIVVLAVGIALRIAQTIALPADRAYDDHAEPVEIILREGRLPGAADCWECYQPPVYYVVSAGTWSVTQQLALWVGAPREVAGALGRKTMQWVSCVAGIGTLLGCWQILRRAGIQDGVSQALGLGSIAFLPAHIQISAMATNDALTYALATAAILCTLEAERRGWAVRWCIMTGALAGLSVCTKAYGAVTVAAIVSAVGFTHWMRARAGRAAPELMGDAIARARWWAPMVWIFGAALVVGSGPTFRNVLAYGRLQVDNFDFRDTPMLYQPPGRVAAIDFFSVRWRELFAAPWLHARHVDSFWTEQYGRMWFDYEGFHTSLSGYPGWETHWKAAVQRNPQWKRARWDEILSYGDEDVPPHFRWLGVVQYWAGLPLTAVVLIGIAGGVVGCVRLLIAGLARRASSVSLVTVLLTVHCFGAWCVPVVQTLRLPHFSAMKAAFALSAVSSAAFALAGVVRALRGGVRTTLGVVLGAALIVTALSQCLFVLLFFLLPPGR